MRDVRREVDVDAEQGGEMKVIYIAGPFGAPTSWQVAENIRSAERLALEVWRLGAVAICPHANSGTMAGALPEATALAGYLEVLRRCDAVLLMPDWRQSPGACQEHAQAKRERMPTFDSIEGLRQWL